jgi:acetate kinase
MQPKRRSDGHVILCLNSGSSSLTFALYQRRGLDEQRLAQGAVERIGLTGGHLWL